MSDSLPPRPGVISRAAMRATETLGAVSPPTPGKILPMPLIGPMLPFPARIASLWTRLIGAG